MGYDEKTAERVRKALAAYPRVRERAMMGTLCFMVNDVMTCGVLGDDLFIRVGVDAMEPALNLEHAKPVLIRKRAMRAYVGVKPEGFRTAPQVVHKMGQHPWAEMIATPSHLADSDD